MSLAAVMEALAPVCAHENDLAEDDSSGAIRTGYHARRMGFFDEERGISTALYSFRPEDGFHSPRHSHLFSHVRYVVSGEINYGLETAVAGDCTVVPDNVPYGPLKQGSGDLPHFLQIDFMGPAGVPMVNFDRWRTAVEELAQTGTVEDGIYRPTSGQPRDAFAATMEHITGQPLPKVKPLMRIAPTVHTPDLPWLDYAPGVSVKHIFFLFHTGPNVKMVRLQKGASLPGGLQHCQQARCLIDGRISWDGREYDDLSMMFYPPDAEYPATTGVAEESTILVAQWVNAGQPPPPFAVL